MQHIGAFVVATAREKEIKMASEEILTITSREEYFYLYTYTIEGKCYTYFDYFKDQQEAETTILFFFCHGLSVSERSSLNSIAETPAA